MKAKVNMQGLPIQNLIKMPMKSEGKATSNNAFLMNQEGAEIDPSMKIGKAETDDLGKLIGKLESKNPKEQKEFASLFQEIANGKDVKVNPQGLVEKNTKVVLDHDKKVVSTNSNLDQLLNNLKGTNIEEAPVLEDGAKTKQNFFPNQKIELHEKNNESPLEFLVKETKGNKVTEENPAENKKSFFPNEKKIPNNLLSSKQIDSDSNLATKENLKLMSGADFVETSKFKSEPKLQQFEDKNFNEQLGLKNKSAEVVDLSKMRPNVQLNVKNYQQGQNVLNDNLIKSTKDLAFKDQKKVKQDAIEELKSPELKKANDLAMIKEAPITAILAKDLSAQNNLRNSSEAPKILDLSKTHVTNTNQLIEKISDYVMQSNVAGKDQIELTVKHDSLGQFQIQVVKSGNVTHPNQIDMQIVTSNHEGHKFFVENEGTLVKSLQQSGVSLSDLRIVSNESMIGLNSFSESKQFNSFGQNQNGQYSQEQRFESFQSSDFKNGNERRKDLWNEYRERYGA